jgi:diguanylate cyclase (GGDEF)-like protein
MTLRQLRYWFENLSRAQRDLIYLALFILASYFFVVAFDALDRIYEFTRAHEYWELDEIFALLICAGVGAGVYAIRRLSDLRQEVGKRIRAEEAANQLARHDSLTGLPNRRDFLARAGEELLNTGGGRDSAFFVIDLDYFKPVNDLYGHRIGDGVLCEVARRLKRALDGQGMVARLGGDEFGVFISALQNRDAAERIARRMVHDIGQPIYVESLAITIGVSIGITLIDSDDDHFSADHDVEDRLQQCIRRADMAMYRAKTQGRGRFRFFEKEMDEKLKLHVRLEAELASAISSGEIVPYYQQLVNLSTQEVIGFEILSRWHHPVHGVIAPDVFIPIAEDTGLISSLTVSVLQQAIDDAARWPQELFLSLNLSPRQLANKMLAQELLGILTKSRFPPRRLEIEITESGLLERIEDVRGVLQSLRNIGVRIALDDFGTGYSGLYHLRDLQIDTIKIDRSFVTHMLERGDDSKIVEAVVKLGNAMGLTTIAEGVETPDVIERLLELGCESGQGFYFGKPMPAKATSDAIRRLRTDLASRIA